MGFRCLRRLSVLCASVAFLTLTSSAQEPRATGVVRTAQGVPVPGVTVRLTDPATGKAWVSWTDENGKFDFPGLPAGRYRLEAQQIGFEATAKDVEAGPSAAPVEVTLKVAPLAAAAAPATTKPEGPNPQSAIRNPQLQEVMRRRMGQGGFQQVETQNQNQQGAQQSEAVPELSVQVDTGPLGEASSSDAFLIRGTVGRGLTAGDEGMFPGMFGPPGGGQFGGGPFGQGEGGGAFPGGAPGGAPGAGPGGFGPGGGPGGFGPGGRPGGFGGMGPRGGRGAATQAGRARQGQRPGAQGPPRAGAQAGRGGFGEGMEALWGAQRMMRLAANRVRFNLNERFGHSAADARPYSLTEPNPAKIASYREHFSAGVGGPLRIPKVYDGREKTFFFINYEMNRRRNPVDTFATVPTGQERQGDFSARGLQLFDPAANPAGPRVPLGSVIPPGRLDTAAVGLLRFVPMPNLSGTAQNFHLQTRVPNADDRVNVRLLDTISPKLNFSAVYNLNDGRSQSVQSFPALGSRLSSLGQNVMLGLTQNWTQRFIHDTRLNWNRNRVDTLSRFAFLDNVAGNLGITGISTDPVNYGVPRISFNNFTGLNDPIPALRRNQQLRFMDNLTWAKPHHTLRAGVELRRQQNNNRQDPVARGSFTFTGLMTSQLDARGRPVPGTGSDLADFLLGLPQSTTVRFGSSSTYFRSWGFNTYVQDDWRIRPRFTLNWGLRYELATPPIELFNHIANLDVNAGITAVGLALPGVAAPFSGQLPRSLLRGDYNNWSPRIGIAWRPPLKRNLIFRAGYGMFYNGSIYNQLAASLANQPPWAQAQTRLTSSSRILTLENGFPPEPPGTVANTVAVDPNYRVGYAQIWNASLETQIRQGLVAEVTYTDTKGTHLDLLRAPNRALPGGPLDTELRRRIPSAVGFTYDTFGASSIYHALQVRLQRRMSRGLMFQGLYTFGKSIDDASSIGGGGQVVVQDDNNFAAERGLSSFNQRHQFRSFYAYELPFGERKRWANKGWQAALLGNWQISGNTTLSSGTPFTARLLGAASNNSGTGNNFSERPDQVASASLPGDLRTPLQFFNTLSFVLPAPGLFGNAARNTIPGPATVSFNFSVSRALRFGRDRQRRMDLRWEVQNLLNHPNFTGLGTALGSSNFGRVLGARAMRTIDMQMRFNF